MTLRVDLADMEKNIAEGNNVHSAQEYLELAMRLLTKSRNRIEASDATIQTAFDDLTYMIFCATQAVVHMRQAGIANPVLEKYPAVDQLVEAQRMLYEVGVLVSNAMVYFDSQLGVCEKHKNGKK